MEETEELCLQREQREVGALGCSVRLPLPSMSHSGDSFADWPVFLAFGNHAGEQDPQRTHGKVSQVEQRGHGVTVLGAGSGFLSAVCFFLPVPRDKSEKHR